MKMTRKQTVGENLLYVMVWAAIILVPVLNSQMMSELHISFENVLIAWRQIAPYFIIFIIHNSVLAPRLMLRRKYKTYLLCDLALIIAVFWLVDVYEEHLTDHFLPHGDPEAFDAYRKASFSNLAKIRISKGNRCSKTTIILPKINIKFSIQKFTTDKY